jgi:hypothetical protein
MAEKTILECDGCHKLACGCVPDFLVRRAWPSGFDFCGDCYQARLKSGAEAMKGADDDNPAERVADEGPKYEDRFEE